MCDYSLCGIPNRLAAEGEELIVHRFGTGSMGLASPADLRAAEVALESFSEKSLWHRIRRFFEGGPPQPVIPAVCIPPGACLRLHGISDDLRRELGVGQDETVRFTQLSANVNTYRDAIQFRNGRQVCLQDLRAGLRAEVLSLTGSLSDATAVHEEQEVFVR